MTRPATPVTAEPDLSRKEETALRIMDAAQVVMRRNGLSRLSMREVGKVANVSRANLYRYFPSKEDLLGAVAQFRLKDFAAQMAEAMPAAGDRGQMLDGLIAFLSRYYTQEQPKRFFEHEPEFSIMAFRENFPHYLNIYLTVAAGRITETPKSRQGVPLPLMAELLIRLMLSDVLVPSAPQPLFITRFRPYLQRIMAGGDPAAPDNGNQSVERTTRSGSAAASAR